MSHAGHKYKTWVRVQKISKPVKEFDPEPAVWEELYLVPVSVNTPSATELQQAEQMGNLITHRVRMRWMPGIDTTMRLHVVGTQRFLNILSVLNYKDQNKYLDLMCIEEPTFEAVEPPPIPPDPPEYETVECANCTNNSGASLPGTMRKHIRVDLQGFTNGTEAGTDDYADYLNRTHEFEMEGCSGTIVNTAEFAHTVTMLLQYTGIWELTITIDDETINAPTLDTGGDCDIEAAWLPFVEQGGDYADAAAAWGSANVQGPLATIEADPTANPANAKIWLRSAPQELGGSVSESLEVYQAGELVGSLTLPLYGNRADLSEWRGEEVELRYTVTEGQQVSQAQATVTVADWSAMLTVNPALPVTATNFHTITDACIAAIPGCLIEVQGDGNRYQCWNAEQEPGRIPFTPPSYSVENCTMRGVGATKPIIDGNMGNQAGNGTVLMSRGINQVFENIDIEFGYVGALFQDLDATDNTVRQCEVRDGRGIGIQVNGSTRATFDHASVQRQANWGQDGVGFYFDGGTDDVICGKCQSIDNRDGYSVRNTRETRLIDCISSGASRQGALILGATNCHVIGGDYSTAGATGIQNENNSVGTVLSGVAMTDNNNESNPGEVGTWTDDSENTLVEFCTIKDNSSGVRSGGNGCGAMDRYQSDNTIWRFNKIFDNVKVLGGQDYGAVSLGNNDSVGFYHNTIKNNGVDHSGNRGGLHMQHSSPMSPQNEDITFINNIVSETLGNSQATARTVNWRGNILPETGELLVEVGELLTPTSLGQHVVPLDPTIWGGGSPKFVIFFHSQFTEAVVDDIVNHAVWGFGIAVNAAQQGVIGLVDIHAQGTTRVDRNQQWGKCIVDLTTDGRVINEAAFVSYGANQMTLDWTEYNESVRVRMKYLAIGGDAVEGVELQQITGRTTPGRTTYSTQGSFNEPRSLLTFSAYNQGVDGNHGDAHINIGACDAPESGKPETRNEQISFYSQDGVTNSNVSRGHKSAFIRHHNYDTVLEEATAICECNSFHITWQVAPPVANQHFVLALRGPSIHLGQYVQNLTDGIATRELGFVPSCAMLFSAQALADDLETDGRIAVGAWQNQDDEQTATGCLAQDGVSSANTARFMSNNTSHTLQHYDHAQSLQANCTLLETDGDLVEAWSSVIAGQPRKHFILAFGDIQRDHPPALDAVTQCDNNVYHDPNSLGYQVGDSVSLDFDTYKALMNTQGFETVSVESDPLLDENLTPQTGSPAIGGAKALAEVQSVDGSSVVIDAPAIFWPGDRIVFDDGSTAIVRRVDGLTLILDRLPPAGLPTSKLRLFVPGGTSDIGAVQTEEQ